MSSKYFLDTKAKIINNIELISIHIPKTAGRSFYEVLKFVYADKLDTRTKRKDYFPSSQIRNNFINLQKGTTVIHGHLKFEEISDKIGTDTKLITWMREPIERVISSYYYYMYRISVGKINPNEIHFRSLSLMEYARLKSASNTMSRFLKGSELESFYFVGDFHNFQKGIESLGKLLNWPKNLPDIFENKTADLDIYNTCKTKPHEITTTMKNEIGELNQEDIYLYNKFMKLKKY